MQRYELCRVASCDSIARSPWTCFSNLVSADYHGQSYARISSELPLPTLRHIKLLLQFNVRLIASILKFACVKLFFSVECGSSAVWAIIRTTQTKLALGGGKNSTWEAASYAWCAWHGYCRFSVLKRPIYIPFRGTWLSDVRRYEQHVFENALKRAHTSRT